MLIELGGRLIEYRFVRRRRRTLGISVDADGLKVAAPLRAPWREVEAFLRDKERWILAKLDEWSRVAPPPQLECVTGERLPLFGEPRELEVRHGPRAVREEAQRLVVSVRRGARALPVLVGWLKARALAALAPRVAHYSLKLGLPAPRVALSNARTQWGLCTEEGAIRLSWRLVHVAPALADYVVAHEVAHLVELNHSRRFWRVVSELYPGWREARERLELAGASLPILRGKP
ncbi:MAG TPA: SprT family zinc-dependent metalloprotease [Burkholderiales bacterium]